MSVNLKYADGDGYHVVVLKTVDDAEKFLAKVKGLDASLPARMIDEDGTVAVIGAPAPAKRGRKKAADDAD